MGGLVLWPDTEDGGGKKERSPQGVVGTDCSHLHFTFYILYSTFYISHFRRKEHSPQGVVGTDCSLDETENFNFMLST